MSFKDEIPIVVYDNQCYLCVKFAKIINYLAHGKVSMIGHYTDKGEKIRENILDESALEMFWLIDEENAFGGRAALFPLLKVILTSKKKQSNFKEIEEVCEKECKTAKAVFVRSASLFSNSKKIKIH